MTIDLSGFTGTTTWFRHRMFPDFTYTEGVQYLAEEAKAYWLIDAVLSWQIYPAVRAEEFQVWTLTVTDGKAVLSCTDGNGNRLEKEPNQPVEQRIDHTDFPMESVTLWLTDDVLLLPSEY